MRSLSTHSTQGGPMRELTKTELRIIKELKKQDIFTNRYEVTSDYRNGVIMVACADGDQMYDLFTTHASLCPCNPNRTRIHLANTQWRRPLSRSTLLTKDVPGLLKRNPTASDLKHIKSVALIRMFLAA